MANYFNDSPIESVQDDRYGMAPFAKALAKSILNLKDPIGTAIALTGQWGSGKSSTVNLIRNELESAKFAPVITEFKCWWYRGEEALALAFLQNLHATLHDTLGDKVKDLVPSLTRNLLQAGPVIGGAISLATGTPWTAVVSSTAKFVGTFFPKGDSLEKVFHKLTKILEKQDRRFLVIIDDIDRLSSDETIAVFRLIKSIGRLPNVIYLLAFDRELADKTVQERYPSEGPHFLEKIIQAGFELPVPLQSDLNDAFLTSVQNICGEPDEDAIRRIMNVFHDVIVPYIQTPRHVARLENAISVTWPAIKDEVNLADFLSMETLRLYEDGLFKTMRASKSVLCGVRRDTDGNANSDARFDKFLGEVPEKRHSIARLALQRLFPRLESIHYGGEFVVGWDAERRICVENHFDTYFRLALSNDALSSARITEIIEHAGDRAFIQATMREAASLIRKSGKSMVPVYLDELTTHAKRVPLENVGPLLSALFEIHDEIDLDRDKDRGFMGMGETTLRYHWLMRALTRDRFSLDARSTMYVAAVETASLGWLVNFVDSARDDYSPREDRYAGPENLLVEEERLTPLTGIALERIREAAVDGSLLVHPDLLYLLYRWRAFANDDAKEVRAWTNQQMGNDAAIILAKAMTGQSWSMGMGGFGGLGDRVAMPAVRANIATEIVDAEQFRARLEEIRQSPTSNADSIAAANTLLEAWDRSMRESAREKAAARRRPHRIP